MRWLLEAYADRRTYGALGYLLLGLPLGVLGFVAVVTGLSFGLGLLVTLIGVPILAVTFLVARAIAGLHRQLAWSMLHAPLPRRPAHHDESHGLSWARLRELAGAPEARREMAYALLSLPLGVVGFSLAVTLVALMFAGIAQPIITAVGVETEIGTWTIDTFTKSLVYVPVSVLFLLVGPRLLLALGTMAGRIAVWFLGRIEQDELKRAVAQSLARDGEMDAYAILDQLQLRFGGGPHLSPTRVQAALLALESSGRVTTSGSPSGPVYRLREQA